MKFLFTAIAFFAAATVYSQTASAGDSMDAQITRQLMERPPGQSLLGIQPAKPNEVRMNGVEYSGILVQMAKTDNPLQLINPAASPEYGSSEDNTARDPVTGKITGLKLFSIRF